MIIESIELKGWKTYYQPVVITGFDRSFNAISGHNGSGKSNILDAVQFLLGTNSKELLRLKNSMVELIYRDGTADIIEASVTMKLRITNKRLRPMGYEDCSLLSITRTIHRNKGSKYYVEGKVLPASQVKKMLECMHLNIDNPHFIVKQGQITKLASSKPVDILAMMEESIGTAPYVSSRRETLETIKKTDMKMKEMQVVIDSKITPFMEELKSERAIQRSYNEKKAQVQSLESKIYPYEYLLKSAQIQKLTKQLDQIKSHILRNQQEAKQLSILLQQSQAQQQSLKQSAEETKILRQKLVKAQDEVKVKQHQLNAINNRLQTLTAEFTNAEQNISEAKSTYQRIKNKYQNFEVMEMRVKENVQSAKNRLETLNKTAKDQLKNYIEKQVKQFRQKIRLLKNQLSTLSSKHTAISEVLRTTRDKLKSKQENTGKRTLQIQKLKQQIAQLKNKEPPTEVKRPNQVEFEDRKYQINNQLNSLVSNCANLKFSFKAPPNMNFNKDDVRGRVMDCFKIKDSEHFKALEIGAGGRLNNVVVMNEKTSSILLNSGVLGNFVSVIPNNKISHREVSQDVHSLLKRVSEEHKGMAKMAYELLTYSQQLQPTMKFVFSTFAVVSSKVIGKAIAYHSNRNLRMKCVTIEGQVLDPNGTLAGGYYNFSNFILYKMGLYNKLQEQLSSLESSIMSKKKVFQQYCNQRTAYQRLQDQLAQKIRTLKRLESQGQENKGVIRSTEDMEEELNGILKQKSRINGQIESLTKTIQRTETMKNGDHGLQQKKKEIQQVIKENEQELEVMKKEHDQIHKQFNNARDTLRQYENCLKTEKQITRNTQQLQKVKKQIRQMNQQVDQIQNIIQQKKRSQNYGVEASELLERHRNNQERASLLKSQIVSFKNSEHNVRRELEKNKEKLQQILQEKADVQKFIEQKNITLQLFPENFDIQVQKKKLLMMTGGLKAMEGKMSGIGEKDTARVEKLYNELMKKLEILATDKENLLRYINDLDQKRISAINRGYQSIRGNLIKIFKQLYPTAGCDLIPIDASDPLKGYEVTYIFGNAMRKSLLEMSGGQKSMLSLSFVFAMLLHRPCPFYFLDQIDAALDQINTQNLGLMIKQHFPMSQFIVISLKECMFRSANVLFTVMFSQNTSKIIRVGAGNRPGVSKQLDGNNRINKIQEGAQENQDERNKDKDRKKNISVQKSENNVQVKNNHRQ